MMNNHLPSLMMKTSQSQKNFKNAKSKNNKDENSIVENKPRVTTAASIFRPLFSRINSS